MDATTRLRTKPRSATDYKAEIAEVWAEIQCLNEQMREDQTEIDRPKAEIHAMGLEAQNLRVETRAILTNLGATLYTYGKK